MKSTKKDKRMNNPLNYFLRRNGLEMKMNVMMILTLMRKGNWIGLMMDFMNFIQQKREAYKLMANLEIEVQRMQKHLMKKI